MFWRLVITLLTAVVAVLPSYMGVGPPDETNGDSVGDEVLVREKRSKPLLYEVSEPIAGGKWRVLSFKVINVHTGPVNNLSVEFEFESGHKILDFAVTHNTEDVDPRVKKVVSKNSAKYRIPILPQNEKLEGFIVVDRNTMTKPRVTIRSDDGSGIPVNFEDASMKLDGDKVILEGRIQKSALVYMNKVAKDPAIALISPFRHAAEIVSDGIEDLKSRAHSYLISATVFQ
jgi:hypothetical protein